MPKGGNDKLLKTAEVEDSELCILEARRSSLFEFIQGIYDKSKLAHLSEINKEIFLESIDTIEDIRLEYRNIVNEYNRLNINLKPGTLPNYQPLNSFDELYCRIKRAVKKLEPAPPPRSEPLSAPPPPVNGPRLPPLEIVYFDGDIKNWPLFFTSFDSLVHRNTSLTDAERLYYLMGKLSPKAQSVFSGVTPCAENYQLIIRCLTDRYHDTRSLASSYVDQMLNLKITGPASRENYEIFLDKFVTAANAFKSLTSFNLTDYMLLHIALKRLDEVTVREFEMQYRDIKVPTFANLTDFIKSQYKIYKVVLSHTSSHVTRSSRQNNPRNQTRMPNPQSYVVNESVHKCICNNVSHDHFFKCPLFETLSPTARFNCVKERNACINCLSVKHTTRDCKSKHRCRSCTQKHHTLLHFDKVQNRTNTAAVSGTMPHALSHSPPISQSVLPSNVNQHAPAHTSVTSCNTSIAANYYAIQDSHDHSAQRTQPATILLSTAQVVIYDSAGLPHVVRGLLDSASQSNFITADCCRRLGLRYNPMQSMVRGIGGSEKSIKGSADFRILSRYDKNIYFDLSGLVVDRITDRLPTAPVDLSAFAHLNPLRLADDLFATPANIDILIGASIFPHLLLPGTVYSKVRGIPPAIQTVLGYILMGSAPALQAAPCSSVSACCTVDQHPLDRLLKQFWELEEVTASPLAMSNEDLECEVHFCATTVRDTNGRYTVALPFRDDVYKLGESFSAAQRRFRCLERKLQASNMLRTAYDEIIREYLAKGYITELSTPLEGVSASAAAYYIPHLAVVNEKKSSTKVRMVLDSSSKTSTGLSINDVLHSGPNLQGDLFCILINFRLFTIALSADCRQMFLNELCAVVLLSQLIRKVLDNFEPRYKINNVYAFTDSKITLCWIAASPHRWQTFVANRVVKNIDNVPASCFHHIAGVENPADCLSRGLSPAKLVDHPLWFSGPPWASRAPVEWPLRELDRDSVGEIPERKPLAHIVTGDPAESPIYTLAQRTSSWPRLLRITVYVCRFLKLLPRSTTITCSDLNFAENKILLSLQNFHFSDDIRKLRNNEPCSPALQKLKPFLDNDGLIRVGGRLTNADIEYTQKHPLILPSRDHVVRIMIDYFHVKHLHAGPKLLMSLLRYQYWILSARGSIRQRIHKCNTCFRAKPRPSFPLMADLPNYRVNQVDKPYSHTGCDYGGPLLYTPVRGRGVKSRKAWLCIFTCLTTRCLHIEIATELSTVNFLCALKRFLSRRGPVQCMYSDHGTNFVGARSYLRDLYKFLDEYRPHFQHELSENRIDWKFIPPASPHWGGCWESMVKLVKCTLYKVIGQQILSYEELLTVLTQIEALVNSRPLTAMSSDPSEPSAITPAHFLHTAPLFSLPAPLVETVNLQERHSLLDNLVQSFWRRWTAEYLHQLQSRAKWNIPSTPITPGTVVIIIVDNTPPFTWPLGVVESVHPSKDGATRVVTVRTSKGSLVRPVVRLCPLPSQ